MGGLKLVVLVNDGATALSTHYLPGIPVLFRNAPQPVKRYDQLVADGLEDEEELVDKATSKDRAWDDWKDDHPRGSGNKLGKRF